MLGLGLTFTSDLETWCQALMMLFAKSRDMLTGQRELSVHLTTVVLCPSTRLLPVSVVKSYFKSVCFMSSIITLYIMLCQEFMMSLFYKYFKHITVCFGTFS